MVTKKLTPTKNVDAALATSPVDVQAAMLTELQKQTEYLHRVDWKLWMIMNMVETIGKDNGYTFSTLNKDREGNDL